MSPVLRLAFQSDQPLAAYAGLAEAADRYPFEALSVYEDLFYQPAWPALMQFALHSHKPLLGPAVANPYLVHPAVIAANLALLDDASGGRAYLGIGRGAFFEALRVAQPRPVRAIREAVDLVQRMLTGDRASYDGQLFAATPQAALRFRAPGRRVRLLIGSWSPATLALAGEIADDVKVGGCVDEAAAAVFRQRIAVGELRAGRAPGTVRLLYGAVTVLDTDATRAERIARARVAMYVAVVGALDPVYHPPADELAAVQAAMAAGDTDRASRLLSDDTLRRFALYGTPSAVARRLEDLFTAGVDGFEMGTPLGPDVLEAIRLAGERVLPAFPP